VKTAFLAIATTVSLAAQAIPPTAPAPAFEVVSIKRNRSGDQNSSTRVRPGGGLLVTNNTLRGLVRNAYMREDFQIVGAPSWFDTDRFDILATGDNQDVPFDVMVSRTKRLLADRFALVVHSEIRELPIYALVPASAEGRTGPQIRQSAIDCRPTSTGGRRPDAVMPPGIPVGEQPVCGVRRRQGFVAVGGGGLAEFSLALSGIVGRTVVDRTGMDGAYDLALTWDADLAAGQGVSLFTAVREQLGLKLEARRGPVEVLVVDRVEPPAEN
jgi:uncharacterized protein (TIGR03435 family)